LGPCYMGLGNEICLIPSTMSIYEEVRKHIKNGVSSLLYLESSTSAQGWVISGGCFRLPFDLDLQDMDIDITHGDDIKQILRWTIGSTERKDTLLGRYAGTLMASCLQCLCSGLAWKASAQVPLPACIDAWFNGTRISFAPISSTVSYGLEENERGLVSAGDLSFPAYL
jgi:hypothetical protein